MERKASELFLKRGARGQRAADAGFEDVHCCVERQLIEPHGQHLWGPQEIKD